MRQGEPGVVAIIIAVLIALVAVAGGYYFYTNRPKVQAPQLITQNPTPTSTVANNVSDFQNPKKSAHYESNTPAHGAILPAPPINVVIDFNFDLAEPSEIRVFSSGVKNPATGTTSPISIAVGKTIIDENKLTMRIAIDPNALDDLYTVEYNACWPDKSCHDGYFQFKIDGSSGGSFTDLRGKKEVMVDMDEIAFKPANIRISKGTTVIWTNKEPVVHYVNTDSHPAHTYFPDQNSKALEKDDTHSVTFESPGAYPYHCSTHEDLMKGMIWVE